jgi:Ca2+/H+ antiporter, TMEM165/GDT1 family
VESLIPAFIAILFAELGSKTQNIAHAHGRADLGGQSLIAVLVSSLVAYGLAAIGGVLIGARLAFEARSLLFALALLFAGLPMLIPAKAPPPLDPRPNVFKSGLLFVRAQFGDGAQFIVFALAARTGWAGLTLLGALMGVVVACGIPIMLGKDWPQGKLLTLIRGGAGIVLSITGFLIGINALRLTG